MAFDFMFSSSSVLVRGAFLLVLSGLIAGAVGCDGGGSSAEEPPPAPSNVAATSQDGAVVLEWEGVSDASGYNVYRDTTSFSGTDRSPLNEEAPIEPSSFTDESVENGTRYYYRVTAVGDGGESAPSSEVLVRPFPSPPDDRP